MPFHLVGVSPIADAADGRAVLRADAGKQVAIAVPAVPRDPATDRFAQTLASIRFWPMRASFWNQMSTISGFARLPEPLPPFPKNRRGNSSCRSGSAFGWIGRATASGSRSPHEEVDPLQRYGGLEDLLYPLTRKGRRPGPRTCLEPAADVGERLLDRYPVHKARQVGLGELPYFAEQSRLDRRMREPRPAAPATANAGNELPMPLTKQSGSVRRLEKYCP